MHEINTLWRVFSTAFLTEYVVTSLLLLFFFLTSSRILYHLLVLVSFTLFFFPPQLIHSAKGPILPQRTLHIAYFCCSWPCSLFPLEVLHRSENHIPPPSPPLPPPIPFPPPIPSEVEIFPSLDMHIAHIIFCYLLAAVWLVFHHFNFIFLYTASFLFLPFLSHFHPFSLHPFKISPIVTGRYHRKLPRGRIILNMRPFLDCSF